MNGVLHDYQEKAAQFAITHPKCGLFLDLGLGKTLTTLAVLERVYAQEPGHILIIAPKSIAKATWSAEIEKWGINIPYKSFIVNEKGKALSKQKRLAAYQDAITNPVKTIYFINRELLSDLIENCPRNGNTIIWTFQTVVIDELQSFKSPDSKRFKSLKSVMPAVNRFIGLTGTPTPNGIEDIWSQIYLMDGGKRLGKNITTFRNTFMQPGYRNPQGIVCSWNPNPGAEDIIYNLISDIVISMKNTNLKLPPVAFIDDYVYMSQDEMKLYKQFVRDEVLEFAPDEIATASNAAVLSTKLQQLASGAIYTINEDGLSTGHYTPIHEQKLERLKYIRENSDDNILISYFFKSDADMIMKYFAANNLPCEMFDSSRADEYLKRWNNNEIPTLLIQPSSAGFGLNFQYGGHTLVWYTLPFNLENYLQTIGRVYRQGQDKTVYIHRIMTHKTIDVQVLKALTEKDANMKRLLNAVELSDTQQESLAAFSNVLNASMKTPISNDDIIKAVNDTLADYSNV